MRKWEFWWVWEFEKFFDECLKTVKMILLGDLFNGKQQYEYSHRRCAKRAIWNVLIPNFTSFTDAISLQFVIHIHISLKAGSLVKVIVFLLHIDTLHLVLFRTSVQGTSGRRGQEDEQKNMHAAIAAPLSLT